MWAIGAGLIGYAGASLAQTGAQDDPPAGSHVVQRYQYVTNPIGNLIYMIVFGTQTGRSWGRDTRTSGAWIAYGSLAAR